MGSGIFNISTATNQYIHISVYFMVHINKNVHNNFKKKLYVLKNVEFVCYFVQLWIMLKVVFHPEISSIKRTIRFLEYFSSYTLFKVEGKNVSLI